MLAIRAAKVIAVAAVALFATLVAFGNITDYNTNFAFVQHVLSMDTIFPFSTIKYRAISDPALHRAAYALIIAAELAIAALCWVGAAMLARRIRADAFAFNRAKAFSKAPEPGLIGGVVPIAYGGIAMLTDYVTADQRVIACSNQDVVYGPGFLSLDKERSLGEVHNLVKDPARAGQLAALRKRFAELKAAAR